MDKFASYGKVATLGTGILFWVLAAPVSVQASPFLPTVTTAVGCCDTMETFFGDVTITRNCCGCETSADHTSMTLEFCGTDVCDIDHFVSECDALVCPLPQVNLGATAPAAIPFTFTAEIPTTDLDNKWCVALESVGFCGNALEPIYTIPFSCTCFGSFEFIPATSEIVNPPPAGFAFFDSDPTGASGAITSVTSAATGVPELDGDTVATPLAVLLGTLLVFSDPRRRRSEEF